MYFNKVVTALLLSVGFSLPLMAANDEAKNAITQAKKTVKAILAKDLKKKIDNEDDLFMLDIREPYMRPEGSIEGMDNVAIARGLLEFNMAAQIKDKNAFIVVYCRSGKGAVLAAKMLKEVLKYKNVVYLKGGIQGWLNAGYSISNQFGELKLAD
ncbi:MAG: rhodanese-like domain-containing protein [Thiovulaceae bacterium]|nr:rhodanese-like domain-containing protein [Sulfurimonadaceae bacterium]